MAVATNMDNKIQNLMTDMKVSEKGARRVSDIIKAGVDILMEEGFIALTKRRIANRLNIAHGNVGYYFPTKESLWRAVFDYEIQTYYDRHFEQTKKMGAADAQAVFNEFIRIWIKEFTFTEMRILFSQINAVSELVPLVAGFRRELFDKLYLETLKRVRALNPPSVTDRVLRYRVLRIIGAMEGLHVVTGFRPNILREGTFSDDIVAHMNALARGQVPGIN